MYVKTHSPSMRKMLQHFTHAQCKMSDKDGCSRLPEAAQGCPNLEGITWRLSDNSQDVSIRSNPGSCLVYRWHFRHHREWSRRRRSETYVKRRLHTTSWRRRSLVYGKEKSCHGCIDGFHQAFERKRNESRTLRLSRLSRSLNQSDCNKVFEKSSSLIS